MMNPSDLGLPFPTWWPLQSETILKIVGAFSGGAKYVTLEAPPGSGKSGIALGVANLLQSTAVILTSTRSLQDQYVKQFQIPEIRGRSNFRCVIEPVSAADGPCTHGERCKMQGVNGEEGCPYYDAKRQAMQAEVYTTNYSYHINETNYIGDFPPPELFVCDEAHNLESHLRAFTTVPRPPFKIADADDVKSWVEGYKQAALQLSGTGVGYQTKEEKKKQAAFRQRASMLSTSGVEWVLTKDEAIPVWVAPLVSKYMFGARGGRFLFTSATIGDPEVFLEVLGINPSESASFSVASQFPKASRPIKYRSVGKVSATAEGSFGKVVEMVAKVLAQHQGERGLVHTTSYALANFIKENCPSPRLLFPTAATLAGILSKYRTTPGAVIVSPAVSTGIDLPYDLCRFQVIAKLPFPNLGDPVRRAQGKTPLGKKLMTRDTVNSLVQAYGRGMRAADDACVTYLFDGNWQWFQRTAEASLPKYFMEAFQ